MELRLQICCQLWHQVRRVQRKTVPVGLQKYWPRAEWNTLLESADCKEKSRLAEMRKRGVSPQYEDTAWGHGLFIVQRQSSTTHRTPKDYRCCPSCLGYYTRQTMPDHTKKCCYEDAIKSLRTSNVSLTINQVMDFRPVASVMKDQDITHMALGDNAILHFGKKLYSTLKITSTVTKMESYASTKMREPARLVINVINFLRTNKNSSLLLP